MESQIFYGKTRNNVLKIFRVLKAAHETEAGPMTVSEIARQTGLHKWTVSRTVDVWMHHFVDSTVLEELEDVGLRIKLVKLANPELTEEQIVRGLSLRLVA
jgi:DNA-binding IclR family transcriptional regulator